MGKTERSASCNKVSGHRFVVVAMFSGNNSSILSLLSQVVTTFELPGCQDIWTVIGDSELDKGHAYLILSRADSTMVINIVDNP
jgi:hypothetical protein